MKGIDAQGKGHTALLEPNGSDIGMGAPGAFLQVVGDPANPLVVVSPAASPMLVRLANLPVYGPREEAINAPDDTIYPVVLDMRKFNRMAVQLILSCAGGTVTTTIEGSMNDAEDHNDIPAAEWPDLTNDAFGVANLQAAAGSAVDQWIDNTGKLAPFCWLRMKLVLNTAGNTGDYIIIPVRWTE